MGGAARTVDVSGSARVVDLHTVAVVAGPAGRVDVTDLTAQATAVTTS